MLETLPIQKPMHGPVFKTIAVVCYNECLKKIVTKRAFRSSLQLFLYYKQINLILLLK